MGYIFSEGLVHAENNVFSACKSDIANEKFAVIFLPYGRSDIKAYGLCDIFAIKTRRSRISHGIAVYHCEAISLADRRI